MALNFALHKKSRQAGNYNARMYIVAIAWIYVTLLMAATEPTVVAGVLTFIFYGLLPLALLLWLFGTPQRRRVQARREAAESSADAPGTSTPPNADE